MPSETAPLNESIRENIEVILDEVEKAGRDISREVVEDYLPLVSRYRLDTRTATDKIEKFEFNLNTFFWRIVRWWFRRKKRYLQYLSKLMSLPVGASALKEDTVSFRIHTKDGEVKEIRCKYTGYDLLEFLVTYSLLSDPEGRKELLNTIISSVENKVIEHGGKLVSVREFLESNSVKWEEFRSQLEKMLNASIANYLYEIHNTEGSRLAKHIVLREQALSGGDIKDTWLFYVNQTVSLAIMAVYSKAYVASFQGVRETFLVPKPRSPIGYYRYVLRFGEVIDNLSLEALDAVPHIQNRPIKRWFRKRRMSVEEAVKEFERIKREAEEVSKYIPAEMLPEEVLRFYTSLPVNEQALKDAFRKSRARRIAGEDLNINLQ